MGKINWPDDAKLIEMYNSGMSTITIGEQLGCLDRTVAARLKKLGVTLRGKVGIKKLPKSLVEDYRNGMSMSELMTKYDSSRLTIVRRLSDFGIEHKSDNNDPCPDIAVEYYLQGMSAKEAGIKAGGWSESAVLNLLRRKGIQRRKKKIVVPENVVNDYNRTKSTIAVAKKYNVSDVTAGKWLKDLGVELSNTRIDWPDNLAEMYESGMSIRQLAEKIGTHFSTVRNKLVSLGLLEYRAGTTPEQILEDLLLDNNFKVIMRTKDIISPKEIDCYLPEINTCVEVNGYHWHTLPEAKYKHTSKFSDCQEANVRIIQVLDIDVIHNPDHVLNLITNNQSYEIDNLVVKEISKEEYYGFYGIVRYITDISSYYGAFNGDTLVGVIASHNGVFKHYSSIINANVFDLFAKELNIEEYHKINLFETIKTSILHENFCFHDCYEIEDRIYYGAGITVMTNNA